MFDINTKTTDFMTIVVTHECQKRCPFCVDAYRGRKGYISTASVSKALAEAAVHKVKDILFVGGEPTLHPDLGFFLGMAKHRGFRTILTTNYVKKWNDWDNLDFMNISYHGQELPEPRKYRDITISALIHKKQLETKEKLDEFIDKHKNYNLKFSTLVDCNDWTRKNQKVDYLDNLDAEVVELFGLMEGLVYRGCPIKRWECITNDKQIKPLKCHVDGKISRSWER